MILKDNYISKELINQIPTIPKLTGYDIFDIRKSSTWKEQLEKYLNKKVEYTGDILDYEKLLVFMDEI